MNISPPASLETRRHREYKCGVYFAHTGTCARNKRHGFLKEYFEGEELSIAPPLSRPEPVEGLMALLQGTVAGISDAVPRSLNTRHIQSSLCLRVSSEAGGESFLVSRTFHV